MMQSSSLESFSSHESISLRVMLETAIVYLILAVGAIAVVRSDLPYTSLLLLPIIIAEGLWLDRIYIVGHEAVHKKLFPKNIPLNDLIGRMLLTPIAAPLSIYRKIHYFHHGSNRKDPLTAALDSFTTDSPVTPGRRLYYRLVWLFYVYLGGFFVHSLVSILLFLLAPVSWARTISPVFNGWKPKMRGIAWIEFLIGLAFHGAVWIGLGFDAWLVTLGLPLAVFAWFWSLLLYIYHYDTTIGPDVRHNVRSLPRHWFFSWLLLNFNEHATHHFDPSIPWYALPRYRHDLPAEFKEKNEKPGTIWQAIWQQRKGPMIWDRSMLTEKDGANRRSR
jgi:fatty acid desaturase